MILVTGFKPFLGETINPSAEIISFLQGEAEFKNKIKTLLLPVVFAEAFEILKAEFQSENYTHVVMLGQAGGRDKISLERVALNWFESEHPDESGWTPKRESIAEDASSAEFTEIKIESVLLKLKSQGIPAEISLSAGGYVCNFLYFKVLSELTKKAVFVHVPYLPEQVKTSGTVSMPLVGMISAVKIILESIVAE